MSRQFTASMVCKVDGKGRVSVPAVIRRVLEVQGAEGRFYLVPGFRNPRCIEGYSPEGHAEIADRIAEMHPADRARRKLEHRFLARSLPFELDDTGRIVLAPRVRAEAGIEDEALFVGLGDSFQIWNPQAYDAEMEALFADDEADADPLAAMPWRGTPA